MDVRNLTGKTALVTGAASGIGRATALCLARRGAHLVICDVNESGLAETADSIRALGRDVLARQVDVGSAEEMGAFSELVHREIEALDLLMNNAGVGLGGLFLDTTLEDWEWVTRINLFGVIHGCHFFVPAMVKRGAGGHVINISSMAGYTPLPVASGYCTTKYAVLGFSEVLRAELAPVGVGVTAVCPGFIDTAIIETPRVRGIAADQERRDRTVRFYRRRGYGPDRVAENILKAVQRNRLVAPISPEAWLSYYGMRLIPGFLRWAILKAAQRTVGHNG